jgi:hypothetical protein
MTQKNGLCIDNTLLMLNIYPAEKDIAKTKFTVEYSKDAMMIECAAFYLGDTAVADFVKALFKSYLTKKSDFSDSVLINNRQKYAFDSHWFFNIKYIPEDILDTINVSISAFLEKSPSINILDYTTNIVIMFDDNTHSNINYSSIAGFDRDGDRLDIGIKDLMAPGFGLSFAHQPDNASGNTIRTNFITSLLDYLNPDKSDKELNAFKLMVMIS